MELNIEKLEDKTYMCVYGPAIPAGFEYVEPLPMPPRPPMQIHTVPLPPNYNYIPPPKLPLFADIVYDNAN
jgi:hypothetical protein